MSFYTLDAKKIDEGYASFLSKDIKWSIFGSVILVSGDSKNCISLSHELLNKGEFNEIATNRVIETLKEVLNAFVKQFPQKFRSIFGDDPSKNNGAILLGLLMHPSINPWSPYWKLLQLLPKEKRLEWTMWLLGDLKELTPLARLVHFVMAFSILGVFSTALTAILTTMLTLTLETPNEMKFLLGPARHNDLMRLDSVVENHESLVQAKF